LLRELRLAQGIADRRSTMPMLTPRAGGGSRRAPVDSFWLPSAAQVARHLGVAVAHRAAKRQSSNAVSAESSDRRTIA
jgi:hypothetical protein